MRAGMDHKYHPPSDSDELHELPGGIAAAAVQQRAAESLIMASGAEREPVSAR